MNPMICSSVYLLLRIALPLRCADFVPLRRYGFRGAGHERQTIKTENKWYGFQVRGVDFSDWGKPEWRAYRCTISHAKPVLRPVASVHLRLQAVAISHDSNRPAFRTRRSLRTSPLRFVSSHAPSLRMTK
jgi:hypothetical protein